VVGIFWKSVLAGIVVALTGSCATDSIVDGVPSVVPPDSKKYYKAYLNDNTPKAFAYVPHHTRPLRYWYVGSCANRPSAEDAITCAVNKCTNNKNNSQWVGDFPGDCVPFAVNNVLINGKSNSEIAGLAEQIDQKNRPKNDQPAKSLPLKEAMEATVKFEQPKITVPPRTIEDITAILDSQKLVNPEETNNWITALRAPVPKTKEAPELAKFFLRRAVAAYSLGHLQQAFDDIRTSAQHLKNVSLYGTTKLASGGRLRKGGILKWQAKLEARFGNFLKAQQLVFDHLDKYGTGQGYGGQAVSLTDQLIESYKMTGNVQGAIKARDRVKHIMKNWRNNRGSGGKAARNRLAAHGLSAKWKWSLLEMQGRWRDAEPHIRTLINDTYKMTLIDQKAPHFVYQPYLFLSTNLVRQGRLQEAETVARDALRGVLGVAGKYNLETITFISALAEVLEAQGRFREAIDLHSAGLEIQTQLKVPEGSYFAEQRRFRLAEILVSVGEWDKALTLYDQVRDRLGNTNKLYHGLIRTSVAYPLALVKSRRFDEAVNLLSPIRQKGDPKQAPKRYQRAEKLAVLAMALAGIGDTDNAITVYRRAIPFLTTDRDDQAVGGTAETTKEKRLVMILDEYIKLIGRLHKGGRSDIDAAGEIFRVADVIRGRSVQTAIAASGARMAAGRDDMAELARREQDAARQMARLADILSQLLSSPTDQQDPQVSANLRDRINELRLARETLLNEIKTNFPDYAALIKSDPLSISGVQKLLTTDEVLVSFYVAGDRTYGWAIPKSGPVGFSEIDMGKAELSRIVTRLRNALDPGQISKLSDIPKFDTKAAYRLYERLLKPLEGNWKNTRNILFVGDGALRQLPVSLLPTGPTSASANPALLFEDYRTVPWLARSHSVTVLPSVSSLSVIRATAARASVERPFLGFGDPFFSKAQEIAAEGQSSTIELASRRATLRNSPKTRSVSSAAIGNLPRLPDTRREITSIATALGAVTDRDVYLGKRAHEGQVKGMDLKPYKVISFATHGLVSGDLDGLDQPALALTSPTVSGVDGDGLLTMEEILGLRLNAEWVVLSACNTAAASGAGAEAISGLGRAFFYAGARALLVSNWPVHSGATTELMRNLFALQSANPTLNRANTSEH
jgi:CHAT domain-containing protein